MGTLATLIIIMALSAAAPVISDRLARWLVVPGVVLELAFGVLIGPQGLNWATETPIVHALAHLGLATLIFLVGLEINFAIIPTRIVRRAVACWLIAVVLGVLAAAIRLGRTEAALVVGLALTTTALGTILPVVRDAGLGGRPIGTQLLANGVAGEFGPIVAISLVLTTDHPLRSGVLLLVFVAVTFVAALLARQSRLARVTRLLSATLGTSAQLLVRLSLLLLLSLVWVADRFGLDMLLGAFAAGIVIRLLVTTVDPTALTVFQSKMDAIGFGFLIPIFVVVSGMRLDVRSLGEPLVLAALAAFVVLFVVVRGGPVFLLQLSGTVRERAAVAMFCATALPLIVVITDIGVKNGIITQASAAALVGAGSLSVLIFPVVAGSLLRTQEAPPRTATEPPGAGDSQ